MSIVTVNVVKFPDLPDDKKDTTIDYSVYDFYSHRARLIEYIKVAYPNDYSFFSESDLGMMFLELVSYMGAVISHKSDMLANESFLKTVKTRSNLSKLLELIGKKVKGQTSAIGSAKITFDTEVSVGTRNTYIPSDRRSVSVTSDLDGGSVTYTLYELEDNNTVKNLSVSDNNVNLDVYLPSGTSKVFSGLVLLEGTLVVDSGVFSTNDSSKVVSLSNNLVIEDSVGVFVKNIAVPAETGEYKRVEKLFFASGGTDKVFSLELDDSDKASVVFGDNLFGINPSINAEYTIVYRVGGGERGNKAKEALNVPIIARSGASIYNGILENYSPIVGGLNVETMSHAKRYHGSDFARQNRVVTLNDYIVFANEYKTLKATASARKAFSSANIIDIFVLSKTSSLQLARANPNDKKGLLEELDKYKLITDQPVICDGLIRTLDLDITINIDKESSFKKDSIKLAVANNIEGFFSVDRFEFGKSFVIGDLNKIIYKTDGVRFSTINNIKEDVKVDFNEIIQLNNYKINVVEL